MIKVIVVSILLAIIFIVSRPTTMPSEVLKVYDKDALVQRSGDISGCVTDKCLIIYIAPWCPTCQKITPTIISLVDELKNEDITVTVVVGKDKYKRVVAYANKFPFPVLTDANGSYFKKAGLEGVPYFAVTDSNGDILNDYFGGYTNVKSFRKKLEI